MQDNRANNYDRRARVYDYDDFVSRSTRGTVYRSSGKNRTVSRERYEKMRDQYNSKLKRCLIAGVLAGALAISGIGYVVTDAIPNMVNTASVSHEIRSNASDFQSQYINPNTHRTMDGRNYYFDYYNIYQGLSEFGDGDFDLNLYYCLEALDSKQTSEVLDCSDQYRYHIIVGTNEYGEEVSETRSLRNYLYQNGFYEDGEQMLDDKAYANALDNFRNYMKDRLVILDRINDMSSNNNDRLNDLNDELFVMDQEHNIYNSRGGK